MNLGSVLSLVRFVAGHPLTRRAPFRALARVAAWQVRGRLQEEITFHWIDGCKVALRRGMTGMTGNLYCGLHEFPEMGFALHILRPGDVFVDVGANVGSYTLLASRVCGAFTVAIEPDPTAMSWLRRNVSLNEISASTRLVQCAAGEEVGVASFTLGLDTMNRMANTADQSIHQVKIRPLDDILEGCRPTLLKLDVEGFEPAVLRGATRTLRTPSLLAVSTESRDPEVVARLRSAGFAERFYDPFTRAFTPSPRWVQQNALYVRDDGRCLERIASAPLRRILDQPI